MKGMESSRRIFIETLAMGAIGLNVATQDKDKHTKAAQGAKGTLGMKRVTGIGGIFFKSEDSEKLYAWYEKHLGIRRNPDGSGVKFLWHEQESTQTEGMTIWSIFPKDTKYFNPSHAPFMINYRVEDLNSLLVALKAEGVEIDPHREDGDYGRVAWIIDLDGNRVELWEPPKKNS